MFVFCSEIWCGSGAVHDGMVAQLAPEVERMQVITLDTL